MIPRRVVRSVAFSAFLTMGQVAYVQPAPSPMVGLFVGLIAVALLLSLYRLHVLALEEA